MALLLFVVVLLLFVVVVMMMIVVGLLLLFFASRVVGCSRHPLLPSPIRLPVVGLWLDPLRVLLHVEVRLRLLLTLSKLWLMLRLLTISHLTQNIPTVSGHQVFLVVDTVIRPQVP